MRLPIVMTAAMFAVSIVSAQERTPQLESAIIPVKTLHGDSFDRLTKLLAVFGAKSYAADDKLRAIVVYAPADVIVKMRRVVEQLDQPGSEAAIGRNIEMILTFLRCSTSGQPEARPLPADLESVAKQLRAVTQYKNIQLWDIVPLHLQEGKDTQQSLRLPSVSPDLPPNAVPMAQIRIRPEGVSRKDSGRYVRFDRLDISFRVPQNTASGANKGGTGPLPLINSQFTYVDVGLNTAGEFKEGQKAVLGKVSGLDEDSSIFAVISLKVLD